MKLGKIQEVPHRRFNPLLREWILVSPHRNERPWQGRVESREETKQPEYDPACYLCPGNQRAGQIRNPSYSSTFVFENDFAAMKMDVPALSFDAEEKGIVLAETEAGICRVVCFSPRHDLTIAGMTVEAIRGVVDVWAAQYLDLGAKPEINHVEIFENRGAMMGCSNPHPHGQIWANHTIPNVPLKEQASLQEYRRSHGGCMLCDYCALELEAGERVVCQNEYFIVVVPFWATWPFEVLLLSKQHVPDIALDEAERHSLAAIMKQLTLRYDALFHVSFPYTMGFHQQPTDGQPHPEWHLHAHYLPPLLRSATVRKFMVGYEMLASPQRDITPESAARRLREVVVDGS